MNDKIKSNIIKILKPLSWWIFAFYILWLVQVIAIGVGTNDEVYLPLVALLVMTSISILFLLITWFFGFKFKGLKFKKTEWWKWLILVVVPFSYHWLEASFEIR